MFIISHYVLSADGFPPFRQSCNFIVWKPLQLKESFRAQRAVTRRGVIEDYFKNYFFRSVTPSMARTISRSRRCGIKCNGATTRRSIVYVSFAHSRAKFSEAALVLVE